jgi:hypothetical protein
VSLRTPGLPVEASRQGLRWWMQHDRDAADFGRQKLFRLDTGAAVVCDGEFGVAEGAIRAALYGVPKAPQLVESDEDRATLFATGAALVREPAADRDGLCAWRWYDSAVDVGAVDVGLADVGAVRSGAPGPGSLLVRVPPYDYPAAVTEARYARMTALVAGGDPAHLAVLRRADHLCQVRAVANCARFAAGAQRTRAGAVVATCVRCRGREPAVGVTAALAWLG